MEIKIQPDYWLGTKCVEYEVPWQTPASIYHLDKLCSPADTVLEIGTGGSTLFYARRCKHVVAIETNPYWFGIMSSKIREKNLTNVTYMLLETQELVEEKLKTLSGFSIASVDSVHGYSRSAFLKIVLENNLTLDTLVLDNYGDIQLFPEHYNKTIAQLVELLPDPVKWKGQDFNDSRWCGQGTRILTSKI